eukprot:5677896-Pyramimonas_sp.AAC.2
MQKPRSTSCPPRIHTMGCGNSKLGEATVWVEYKYSQLSELRHPHSLRVRIIPERNATVRLASTPFPWIQAARTLEHVQALLFRKRAATVQDAVPSDTEPTAALEVSRTEPLPGVSKGGAVSDPAKPAVDRPILREREANANDRELAVVPNNQMSTRTGQAINGAELATAACEEGSCTASGQVRHEGALEHWEWIEGAPGMESGSTGNGVREHW